MRTLSLTARVSLLFAAGAVAVLLALGWVMARAVQGHFEELDRHEAEGKRDLLAALFAKAAGPTARAGLERPLRDALVGHHHLSVSVYGPDGRAWFRYGHAPVGAAAPPSASGASAGWAASRDHGRLTADLADGNGTMHRVDIVVDTAHHRQFMVQFQRLLAVAVALAALVTAALGWAASRAGLAPLARATRLATRLSAESLGERLPVGGQPAEIDALASAFNAMLARLEEAFRRLSEFSSDIAHELRTPLSNLMTQTQVALSRARTDEEYREVLASSLEEYERLARMTGDMLFLAQADDSRLALRRETLELAREGARLLEFYEALAAESGVTLKLEGAATVTCDRLMLQRALSNLLSNAIRHCPRGGTVTLGLANTEGGTTVRVENPGEIPAEHLPRLFDRFYTGDPARRASGEGAGLGLAITRSIVEAHGGSIEASSADGRIRFRIVLPG